MPLFAHAPTEDESIGLLGIDPADPSTLPFCGQDTTAGTETELQVAVVGNRGAVDLPRYIEESRYLANLRKRVDAGDNSARWLRNLESYLEGTREQVWENSWVRFSSNTLAPAARETLERDLLSNRQMPERGLRSDSNRFLVPGANGKDLRIPISDLLRVALIDAVSEPEPLAFRARPIAVRLLPHLMNDNTSPETSSFRVVHLCPEGGNGAALARETSKRFLLTHLLLHYANEQFGLRERGQKARIFFSPHPPVRQKMLNEAISDSFYRHLFISPCLAWDSGESKHRYMQLCHQVLSRSHLNAIGKLRDAGIITNNLVVLPTVSNISLANNGTHINLGSRKITERLEDPGSGFGPRHEKVLGDLAIKVCEHFLTLSVGTFSAAPYRLPFHDFHPERALGFLAHELDYTHLRMLWRRWKKKTRNRVLGRPLTPFGPPLVDLGLSRLLGLQGDLVPDFRLVDYPVAWMSTSESPALDGNLGNIERLQRDLDSLGVSDARMSLYLPIKLRQLAIAGFSGFEGRHYSLFPSLTRDLAPAADLQMLTQALAYKLIASGEVSHAHIPDDPEVESERRQIFFGTAIGIPTFYVRQSSGNRFLLHLIERTPGVRRSRRYRGFWRVDNRAFRLSLLDYLEESAADLIEHAELAGSLRDLRRRLQLPREDSAMGRLSRNILDQIGTRSPFQVPAEVFNQGAEAYYREALRSEHLNEAIDVLYDDLSHPFEGGSEQSAAEHLADCRAGILAETLSSADLRRLICNFLLSTEPGASDRRHSTLRAAS